MFRSRPKKKVILISDGFFLTKRAELGDVQLGGMTVRTAQDGSLRLLDGTLAGSNSTLQDIVQRQLKRGVVPKADIVAAASTNPLAMLGLKKP